MRRRTGLGLTEVIFAFTVILILPACQLFRPARQRLTAQASRAGAILDVCVTHLTEMSQARLTRLLEGGQSEHTVKSLCGDSLPNEWAVDEKVRIQMVKDAQDQLGLIKLELTMEYLKGTERLTVKRTLIRHDTMRTMALGHLRMYHDTAKLGGDDVERWLDRLVEHGSSVARTVKMESTPRPVTVLPYALRQCLPRPSRLDVPGRR